MAFSAKPKGTSLPLVGRLADHCIAAVRSPSRRAGHCRIPLPYMEPFHISAAAHHRPRHHPSKKAPPAGRAARRLVYQTAVCGAELMTCFLVMWAWRSSQFLRGSMPRMMKRAYGVWPPGVRVASSPWPSRSSCNRSTPVTGPAIFLADMTDHQDDRLKAMLAGVLANVTLNAQLIPRWDIAGAASATGTSLVLWNLLMVVFVQRRLGMDATTFGFEQIDLFRMGKVKA